ncbi:Isochorismatase domain-containing protein 2 [Armadillidium nasatum]|uniref:Isochorismatase domain-containing protein 1 n=1 Tax=Armadillidium nasatum TaxID=96803 RepID=A0A5N5SUL3_9CRUS|nr:Isochorismatase domain-containing protein 2 [Armadillidium nasatum]
MSPIFIHYEYEHDIPQLTLYFITTKMTSAFSQVKLGSLDQETSALFICDLQEKFSSVISHFPQVIENTKKLLEGCKLLKIPIIVTEQYPKGLGKTVSDLDVKECHVVAKTLFNMLVPEVLNLTQSICDKNLKSVVLLGVEAHVCVEQTAIDLVSRGFTVHVVADCCSSRSQEDRFLAFQRLKQIGCYITYK